LYGTHSLSAVPRPRSSIARRATYVPSISCWAAAKSRALFGISASRWTMLWPSPSRWMSELPGQSRLALPSSPGRICATCCREQMHRTIL
jgi:hypothetical protein